METVVPFMGFYDSIHSNHLESLLTQSDDGEMTEEEYENTDWKKAHEDYSKAYLKVLGKALGIELKYIELNSPKYYNFTTDRIFAEISEEEVEKLKKRVKKSDMENFVREHFTSRDGFMSYYDNDYDLWLSQGKPFDHNQIGALLDCIVEQEFDEDFELGLLQDIYI